MNAEADGVAQAEAALAGARPQRPDLAFPTDDEVTVSASITDLQPEPDVEAPAPVAPPPADPAGMADYADQDFDATMVQTAATFDDTTDHDRVEPALVDEDELIVDDDELLEEER